METIIDTEELKITVSDTIYKKKSQENEESLKSSIIKNTLAKFKLFREIFHVEKLEKLYFEMYDEKEQLEAWRKDYTNLYKKNPLSYSRGYFEPSKNLSSCCLPINAVYKSPRWYKIISTNAHEAFHLYYQKYFYHNDRITWFDEGMAQFLSGEADYWLYNEEIFLKKWQYFITNYITITNLN